MTILSNINKIIERIKMKKEYLLNDMFEKSIQPDALDHMKKLNTIKFSACISNKANGPTYRHRQIRILQIGKYANHPISKKQLFFSKSKKPTSGILNTDINREDIHSALKVQSTKRQQRGNFFQKSQQQQRLHQSEKPKYPSPEKEEFQYDDYLSITQSPKKNVLYISKKKNIDHIPQSLAQKQQQQQKKELICNDSAEQVCRSANLLNKIKLVDEILQIQEEKRTFTNLQQRKKPKIQPNRKNPQELAEEERKQKLQIKRQISMDYAKPFNPPTNISAYAYIVYEPQFSKKIRRKNYVVESKLVEIAMNDEIKQNLQKKYPHSHKVLVSMNSRNAVEIASLTKIMTCILALDLCERYNIDSNSQKITIGKFQSNISGTSAQISEGQTYTLEDLYYGLMLPSGNDASIAIAVWGGRLLLTKENDEIGVIYKKKQCYNRFIIEMNNKAKQLGLQKTTYANSHGLVNPANKSCCYDLAVLCEYAMKNKKFKNIVSCKMYQNTITYLTKRVTSPLQQKRSSTRNLNRSDKDDEIEEGVDMELDSNEDDEQVLPEEEFISAQKTIQWQNTHRLLQQKPQEYIGIKTGITIAAGPCLASCVKSKEDRYFIIIVLGCDKMSMRFKDTQNLKRWAYNREGAFSPKKRMRDDQEPLGFPSSLVPMEEI